MDSLSGAPEERPKSLAGRSSFAMVLLLLLIPAAILAVLYVRRVTDRQEQAIAARGPAAP